MKWSQYQTPAAAERAMQVVPQLRNETTVAMSDPAILELLGTVSSYSGKHVTPETAMRVSVVHACAQLIAGAIATLPLPVYRREKNGDRQNANYTAVYALLNREPTPRFTSATWLEYLALSIMLRRDGFAYIRRNADSEPQELVPLNPGNVVVNRNGNRLNYSVQDDGKTWGLDQFDVLHVPGFGFDGLRGKSVIGLAARQAIGTAIAMEEYSGGYFENGAIPKVAIKTPGDLKKAQIEELRNLWEERYTGTKNQNKPVVLYGGMDIQELTISAQDAQLIESRRFQVEDIARAFGVPPHLVGATDKTTSWGTGLEQMSQGFLRYTLQPYLNRFQQEFNRKLFARGSGYYCEFNTDGFLQTDAKSRSDVFRQSVGGSQGPGWLTINEIRKIENRPPVEGGDVLYVPQFKTANNAQESKK